VSTPRNAAGYGWIPQLPDIRDVAADVAVPEALPASVDLSASPHMPPVWEQGMLGSCTAHAVAAALDYENHRQAGRFVTPSRLWIYYQERVLEGSVAHDNGAQLRDGMKAVTKLGACPEIDWPYDPTRWADKPTQKAYRSALRDRALAYQAPVQDRDGLRSVLASGSPVVFGFTVYETFAGDPIAESGVLDLPAKGEHVIGGHAVLLVGYDDATERFRVRNSWGSSWGQGGYFEMPYACVTNRSLAADFWVLQGTSLTTPKRPRKKGS
jgi:C1A family cysteine protease